MYFISPRFTRKCVRRYRHQVEKRLSQRKDSATRAERRKMKSGGRTVARRSIVWAINHVGRVWRMAATDSTKNVAHSYSEKKKAPLFRLWAGRIRARLGKSGSIYGRSVGMARNERRAYRGGVAMASGQYSLGVGSLTIIQPGLKAGIMAAAGAVAGLPVAPSPAQRATFLLSSQPACSLLLSGALRLQLGAGTVWFSRHSTLCCPQAFSAVMRRYYCCAIGDVTLRLSIHVSATLFRGFGQSMGFRNGRGAETFGSSVCRRHSVCGAVRTLPAFCRNGLAGEYGRTRLPLHRYSVLYSLLTHTDYVLLLHNPIQPLLAFLLLTSYNQHYCCHFHYDTTPV